MEDSDFDLDFNWDNDFDDAKAPAVSIVEDPTPEPATPTQKPQRVIPKFVSARKRLAKNAKFQINPTRSVLEEELVKKEMIFETKCPKLSFIASPRSVSPPIVERSPSPPKQPKARVSRVSMGKSNMIFDDADLNTSFASSADTDMTANTKTTTSSSTSTGTPIPKTRSLRLRRQTLQPFRSSVKSKIQKRSQTTEILEFQESID
ncbi:hypothetical protein M3Y94_01178100 [Aphelenchoides besseyi]|nr:hypothetical protein M3Y94_01178100 [Aphelenchoides besseyi]